MPVLRKYKDRRIPKKTRKGGAPEQSATYYTIGTRKKGTDGGTYRVVKSGESRRRWSKVSTVVRTRNTPKN